MGYHYKYLINVCVEETLAKAQEFGFKIDPTIGKGSGAYSPQGTVILSKGYKIQFSPKTTQIFVNSNEPNTLMQIEQILNKIAIKPQEEKSTFSEQTRITIKTLESLEQKITDDLDFRLNFSEALNRIGKDNLSFEERFNNIVEERRREKKALEEYFLKHGSELKRLPDGRVDGESLMQYMAGFKAEYKKKQQEKIG